MVQKWVNILLHLLTWVILFSMPFLLTINELNVNQWMFVKSLIMPTFFFILFYINYFILIEKLLFKKHNKAFIIYNAILILSFSLIIHFLYLKIGANNPNIPRNYKAGYITALLFIVKNMLPMTFIVIVSVSVRFNQRWYLSEVQKEELKRKNTEAELINLKSQLNPHFLFNTLNNIYALIDISKDRSKSAIIELSRLLRYVIYDNDQKYVPIAKEIKSVKNYISLMRLRFSDNVSVSESYNIAGHENLELPPMLYITLIENAFKHGISSVVSSYININIYVDDKETITCLVENSFFPKNKEDKSGSGIGLENMQRRLELLCHNRYEYASRVEKNKYEASLVIFKTPNL